MPWLRSILIACHLATGVPAALAVRTAPNPRQAAAFRVKLATRPPFFVGQGIDIELELPTPDRALRIELPRVPRALLEREGSRARLIATEPGPLVIPAFRATLGEQVWRSGPTRLDIESVPAAGRPGSYTGAIGPLVVSAEWARRQTTQGSRVSLTIRHEGEGSLGMARGVEPALSEESVPARIELVSTSRSGFPAALIDIYEVRPLEPGTLAMKPLGYSTFDPVARSFRSSRQVVPSLAVSALPRGGASTDGPAESRPSGVGRGWDGWVAAGLAAAVALALVGAWSGWWRPRSARITLARATRQARGWSANTPADQQARRTLELMAALCGMPGSKVVSPDEVETAWLERGAEPSVARDARELVLDCEHRVYGRKSPEVEPSADTGEPAARLRLLLERARPRWVDRP